MQHTYVWAIVGLVLIGGGVFIYSQSTGWQDSPLSTDNRPSAPDQVPDDAVTPPQEPPPGQQQDMRSEIIGMTEAEAEVYAQATGVPFRVTQRDGEDLPVTMDYVPGRINAVVEGETVVDFTI